MPVYKVKCDNCRYEGNQYLSSDSGSLIMKCPQCMRSLTARKIKTAGVIEAEADGVIGYLRYDNKRNANS